MLCSGSAKHLHAKTFIRIGLSIKYSWQKFIYYGMTSKRYIADRKKKHRRNLKESFSDFLIFSLLWRATQSCPPIPQQLKCGNMWCLSSRWSISESEVHIFTSVLLARIPSAWDYQSNLSSIQYKLYCLYK
jgi:hypothetical protein